MTARRPAQLLLISVALALAACGGDDSPTTSADATSGSGEDTIADPGLVVDVDGERGLFVRCTGEGSPTIVMEGGDGDTSDSYAFAEERLAEEARTCVYDRANLGASDPAEGPLQLDDYVADLEALFEAAEIEPPYVLVGTSGGGFLTAGYAAEHPEEVAGMVFVEVPAPFVDAPKEIVRITDPDSPENFEQRDYLQIEKDAWAAREEIGDIPITVISADYAKSEIAAAEFEEEKAAMKTNVADQKGWLVLSPSAEQTVVETGHAVEEEDPDLVIDAILDVYGRAG